MQRPSGDHTGSIRQTTSPLARPPAEMLAAARGVRMDTRERERLMIAVAAMVARRRLERCVKLNCPEAVAIISDFVLEGAREGRSVAELMEAGAHVITRDQVLDGVAEMLTDLQVEAAFPDGPRLVSVHDPIR